MGLPIIFSMLVQAMYNIVDSIFVAQVSQNALTAVSLVMPVQNLMIAVAVGTGIGMNSLLSRRLGEKRHEEAEEVAHNGILLAFVSSLAFMVIGFIGSGIYMNLSSNIPEIVEGGTSYMRICTVFSMGIFMQITFERIVQVTGKTTFQMVAQLTGALINIALDPIFIFGLFGLPALGVTGAAVATVVGQWCAMVVIIILNAKGNKVIQVSYQKLKFKLGIVREIYEVGLPSIVMQSIGSVMTFGMNQILVSFSEVAVNVLGIYFKLMSFVFMPVFGMTSAFIPIVGYNFGAKHRGRIMQAIKTTTISVVIIMTIGSGLFFLFTEQFISMFSPTAELYEIGIPALRIMSLAFPFAGICITFSSCFQAVGKGMFSMYMSIGRQLVILLPSAYILAQVLGLSSVWYSFLLAEGVCVLLAGFFFMKMYREQISVMPK